MLQSKAHSKEQTLFRRCERELRNPGLLSYPFLDGLPRRSTPHKEQTLFRHCERSEAIQVFCLIRYWMDCFVASLLAMTGKRIVLFSNVGTAPSRTFAMTVLGSFFAITAICAFRHCERQRSNPA